MCKRLWFVAALYAGTACAAGAWPGLLPPDTGAVMGISIGRIRATPLGRELSMRIEQQLGPSMAALTGPGALTLLNAIDDVTIAIPQRGSGRGLVVMRGVFSRGVYEEWVRPQTTATAAVGGIRVNTLKSSRGAPLGTAAIAFLDSGLIVGGDLASVREAIARRARPGSIAPALAARVGELQKAYDLWLAARIPPEELTGAAAAPGQAGRMAALAKSIEQLSLGISVGTKLGLTAELLARTPEDAGAVANGLRLLMAMAASGNQPQSQALAPLLQQVDLRPEGKLVKLNLSLTAEQLRKLAPLANGAASKRAVDPDEIVIQSSPKDMGTVRIRKNR
jgi:hypothetical protein